MLSNQEMKTLGRVARVSLDEEETALLCRDLNALLEMSAVLESLPRCRRLLLSVLPRIAFQKW